MPFAPRFARSPAPHGAGNDGDRPAHRDLSDWQGFSHGRVALKYGLAQLGLRRGDRVLMPEFICDAALLPFAALGIEPVFHPVGIDLAPRWDALKVASRDRLRAIMMIHYFGMPQDIDRYRAFSRSHGLLLIEDNAHGFGGLQGGALLGTFGDIGFGSPWKNFPVRHGGLLFVADAARRHDPHLPPEPRRLFATRRRLLSMTAGGWRRQHRRFSHGLQALPPTEPMTDWGIDPAAMDFLARQDFAAVAARRRAVAAVWAAWAAAAGLSPVFAGFPEGAAPLVFPVLCETADRRHALLEWLWRQGIDAYTWPKLPPAVLAAKGDALQLWARMICLPVHQGIDPAALAGHLASAGNPM
jgi:hypothetical protein